MTPKPISEMTPEEVSDHFERESAKKVIRVTAIIVIVVAALMGLSLLPAASHGHPEGLLIPLLIAGIASSLFSYHRTCAIVLCVVCSILAILPVIALAMWPFALPLVLMVTVNIVMVYLSVQCIKACGTLKRLRPAKVNSGTN